MSWQVQEAKQRFSEVLRAVESDGPQVITRHGKEIAVVVHIDEYRRMAGPERDIKSLLTGPPYSDEFAAIMEEVVAERKLAAPREFDWDADS
jgi:prevent-host-death family protein